MSFPNSARFALLIPLLLAAGCYVNIQDRDGDGRPDEPDETYCPCQDNSECSSDEYCFRGECRKVPDQAKACTQSSDCGQREQCINGFCTEICAKSNDCSSPDTTCEQNYCVCPPQHGGGADAGTGTGAPGSTDGGTASCTRHQDCGNGAYCINAVCYLGCQSDLNCPASEECRSGVCHPKTQSPTPSCTSGADCGTGEDCVDGQCLLPCAASTGCGSNETCTLGYCTPGAPPSGSGQACVASCDCPSGETCSNGTCQL